MQTLWQDVRYGVRMLLKQPGFTLICIAALALSIGANTAIFSAANALLLRPLPVEDIDRLVVPVTLREGFDPFGSPFLEYAAYRDRAHCFASSGVATARSFNLTGRGEPERVRGATVMANYLSTLGTKPVLGRTISVEDDRPGGSPLSATDGATFSVVSLILGLVGLFACYVPARAAMQLDAIEALRSE